MRVDYCHLRRETFHMRGEPVSDRAVGIKKHRHGPAKPLYHFIYQVFALLDIYRYYLYILILELLPNLFLKVKSFSRAVRTPCGKEDQQDNLVFVIRKFHIPAF